MGDRVVTLCNFCEIHGPRIVFVCQESSCKSGRRRIGGRQFYGDISQNLLDFYSIEERTSSTEICDGCRSFSDSKPAYLTNDHKRRLSYTGCQYPFRADLFSGARCACVRSLSCEACPGRQGPILFGDAANGYCLSYVFTLKDSKARGFQHSYSIVVISRQLDELFTSYSPVVALLKEIVSRLQTWSNSVFEREGAESADRMPQIAASGRASWMPSGFFLRSTGESRTIGKPRSLKDLTNQPDIFAILHEFFVDIHRLFDIEKAFDIRESIIVDRSLEPLPVEELKNGTSIGEERTDDGYHNCVACDVPLSPSSSLRTLILIYDILGSEAFSILAYHLLIGDQVVVRSACACLNRTILNALKLLLPPGCVKCVESSKEYLESWECNLVGVLVENSDRLRNGDNERTLNGNARKFRHLSSNSFMEDPCVILCVDTPEPFACCKGIENGKNRHNVHSASNNIDYWKNVPWATYHFRMFCTAAATNHFFDLAMPAFLRSLLNLLSRMFSKFHCYEDGLLAGVSVFESLKDEWLRKAKLYYVMSKRGDGEDDSWKSTFFRIAKCSPSDEPVLKFWKSGLDRRFKHAVLAHYAAHHCCIGKKQIQNGNTPH